jgi:hypothetical protein
MSEKIEVGMSDWIAANRREHRAAHAYDLNDFGLNADNITAQYQAYIDLYV